MKLIGKSKFTNRFYDESKALMLSIWKPSTEAMTEIGYKQEMLLAVEHIRKHPTKYFLVYTQNFRYIISPDLQLWTVKNIAEPIVQLGVERLAYVVPHEFISSLSVEQTIEETKYVRGNRAYQFSYFEEENEAIKWLLEEKATSHYIETNLNTQEIRKWLR